MAVSSADLVLLFDVDHTLIDGAALKAGLDAAIAAAAGPEGVRRFWQAYEAVRGELGLVDLPETLERFAREAGDASLGDERFQRHKIRASGLDAAFEGRVLIFEHKEQETEAIRARYPARRYVLIEDKPRILAAVKSALGDLVTTVLVEQGPYAGAGVAEGEPSPDVRLPSIAAFSRLDAAALRAGAR